MILFSFYNGPSMSLVYRFDVVLDPGGGQEIVRGFALTVPLKIVIKDDDPAFDDAVV